ncbi:hypothetical protein FB451DRAFT_1182825 [Mycena latifolia]|nr:hypothetical protein FB451DRAFT_1182825 [Mycena latifolia]
MRRQKSPTLVGFMGTKTIRQQSGSPFLAHVDGNVLEAATFGILGPDGKPNKENYEWKTIPQGAATYFLERTVAAALDTRLNDKPGAYLSNSSEANKNLAPHSSDPAIAAKLWTVMEEITGESSRSRPADPPRLSKTMSEFGIARTQTLLEVGMEPERKLWRVIYAQPHSTPISLSDGRHAAVRLDYGNDIKDPAPMEK